MDGPRLPREADERAGDGDVRPHDCAAGRGASRCRACESSQRHVPAVVRGRRRAAARRSRSGVERHAPEQASRRSRSRRDRRSSTRSRTSRRAATLSSARVRGQSGAAGGANTRASAGSSPCRAASTRCTARSGRRRRRRRRVRVERPGARTVGIGGATSVPSWPSRTRSERSASPRSPGRRPSQNAPPESRGTRSARRRASPPPASAPPTASAASRRRLDVAGRQRHHPARSGVQRVPAVEDLRARTSASPASCRRGRRRR